MPDIVLDYHRLKTPIDHPDGSVTTAKLASLDYITLKGLTADPALAAGRIWFRSDLKKLRFSPDGTTALNLLDPTDVETWMGWVAIVLDKGVVKGYVSNDFTVFGSPTVKWATRGLYLYRSAACATEGVYSTKYTFTNGYIEYIVVGTKGNASFRFVDTNNYYVLDFDTPYSTGDFAIHKFVGGTCTTLAREAVDLSNVHAYLLKFRIVGSTLEAYRDGSLRLSATDTAITSGGIAFLRHEVNLAWSSIFIRTESREPAPQPKVLGYYEVPITGKGTMSPEDPIRPRLPELIEYVDKIELEGYDEELRSAIEVNGFKVNRIAFSYSSFIPTGKDGKPL